MNDPIFSQCLLHNRAGFDLRIIEKQDQYPIYKGDDLIGIARTLDEAISFARNYRNNVSNNE